MANLTPFVVVSDSARHSVLVSDQQIAAGATNPFSVQFDGVDDRVAIADNNFDGLAAGTIEFWFKAPGNATNQKLVFKDAAIDVGINTSGRVFGEITGVANLGEFAATDYADNAWHHVRMTWDGTTLRGYIDGTYLKQAAQAGSQGNSSNTLYIGRRDTTEPLTGYIDEFRISNVARTVSETTFALQTANYETDANTLVLIHFDEGTGTNANDSSSSNNDGTLENGVAWSSNAPF